MGARQCGDRYLHAGRLEERTPRRVQMQLPRGVGDWLGTLPGLGAKAMQLGDCRGGQRAASEEPERWLEGQLGRRGLWWAEWVRELQERRAPQLQRRDAGREGREWR